MKLPVCRRLSVLIVSLLALLPIVATAHAQISFSVSFVDPQSTYSAYYNDITASMIAAGNDWGSKLVSTTPVTLNIEVAFDSNIPTANGTSVTSFFVGTNNGHNVFEQGAAYSVRTGNHPNGTPPDIHINIGTGYLENELWFDPHPSQRTDTVPTNRTDAESVFIHELGHAFAFNGFGDFTTGVAPGADESTFDTNVVFANTAGGSTPFFTGSHAVSVYGGAVPLTYGNLYHVANNDPRPGSDLIPDLMNGVVYYRGSRYDISTLDLAILQDSGVQTLQFSDVPESSTLSLIFVGIGVIVLLGRRKTMRFPI